MPKIRLVLFQTEKGDVPLLDWLDELDERPRAKCMCELRAKHLGINYRVLYSFSGRDAAVVSHGLIKQQSVVPDRDIDLAVKRKRAFLEDPDAHTYEG